MDHMGSIKAFSVVTPNFFFFLNTHTARWRLVWASVKVHQKWKHFAQSSPVHLALIITRFHLAPWTVNKWMPIHLLYKVDALIYGWQKLHHHADLACRCRHILGWSRLKCCTEQSTKRKKELKSKLNNKVSIETTCKHTKWKATQRMIALEIWFIGTQANITKYMAVYV